ncbi:MAG: (deoxy)nucleoside triphosphate pyrophosphohydrolase [Coriobacteriaceae bacterium]|nr:(deoxy)nucleoside triphosphate pyrophosphohydrolase [Coriobacteriaceae bacterium]MCI7438128.1 (deoxy)nucleoside triphosphate pyrophosphohydrolase [Coriobacteriaceae bacterium]MDD7584684.1 (deoxy)nucleoside triphosphate pyrophosphohydrolase [Coriobacteriaceae bacterium]
MTAGNDEERATVHVAAAIIQRDERILAARRAHGMDGWEFPGGKVEAGETGEQACRREVMEEIGCKLQVMWPLDTLTYDYPEFHLVMDCFVCTLAPGAEPRAKAGEHSELRWLGRGELLDVGWLPADQGLIQTLGLAWDQLMGSEHL